MNFCTSNNLNFNNLPITSTSSVVHNNTSSPSLIAKGDSGATHHYISPVHQHLLDSVTSSSGPSVLLPDNSTVTATTKGILPLSRSLTSKAQTAHVIPALHTSLISLGQLADDDCSILLNKRFLAVFKHFKCILTGVRNPTDGLWDIPLHQPLQPATQRMNVIIPKNKQLSTMVQYIHATLFSPTKSTLLKAIAAGNLITWPGMTAENIRKHLPDTAATALGHLDQERQGLQSSKIKIPDPTLESDSFPDKLQHVTNTVVAQLVEFKQSNKGFFDLTGQFPYTSSRGNKYLLILYEYDSNAILAHPLKTRQAHEIKNAWSILHTRLLYANRAPSIYIMDNEASRELKNAIVKYKIRYQLTPPNIHRINAAERAIRTFKNHFIAGLATIDPDFPIREWDRLLPQAETTLNLLRTSRINPKLSAYAVISGNFDFSRTPMAPPGTKVVVHDKANKRGSWAYHGTLGFYVGPAMEHYRCMTCYMPKSRMERVADTIQFLPTKIPFPTLSLNEQLMYTLDKVASILASNDFQVNNRATLSFDSKTVAALEFLTTILHRMAAPNIQTSRTFHPHFTQA